MAEGGAVCPMMPDAPRGLEVGIRGVLRCWRGVRTGIPSPFLLPLGIVIASRWKNLTGRRPAPGPGNVVRRFLSPVVCAE